MSWLSKATKSIGSVFNGLGGGMPGGLLGGLGNGLLGGAFSFLDGANDYYWNRKNMDYQNDLLLKNWNLQNAYNSPVEQMKRFREAGLNPNLIYGQTNMAGSIGTPSAGGSASPISTNILAREQVRNLHAQNDNIVQQNENLKEQARSLRIDNNLRQGAGVLADAPWWARLLMRSLPKHSDGSPKLPTLTERDVKNLLHGVGLGLLNPMHNVGAVLGGSINPEKLPPSARFFVSGDRGYRR